MLKNEGWHFDPSWLNKVVVNAFCVYDREKEIINQCHKFKGSYRAAWLLKAVSCIDLTTLSGDDTCSNITRMVYKAANPISHNVLKALEFPLKSFSTAAVCVYPAKVKESKNAVGDILFSRERLPVAAVSTGFPSGQYSLDTRLQQIEDCVNDGADEIDVVIDRSLVLRGEWEMLYDELVQMKHRCGNAILKTILSVGELANFRNIYKASLVAMMAGSDFIKTSTGKENVNATYPVGLVMMRAIQDYYLTTSYKVGFKAAGGIKTANDSLNWLALVKKELGHDWLDKSLFRIGASGLLRDIEEDLYVLAFNRFPAFYEFSLG